MFLDRAQNRRTVLMFHGIGDASVTLEPDEEKYWITWDTFDSILNRYESYSPNDFYMTFDDGNASDLIAARKMASRGLRGSFFVLLGRIGRAGYLSSQDIVEIKGLGMEIGLHGRHHIDWRSADDATLHSEITSALIELSQICDTRVTSVAIPYGAYNRRVMTFLRAADINQIYTSDRGQSRPNALVARRDPVMCWQKMEDIEAIVGDRVPLPQRIRRSVSPIIKRLI